MTELGARTGCLGLAFAATGLELGVGAPGGRWPPGAHCPYLPSPFAYEAGWVWSISCLALYG